MQNQQQQQNMCNQQQHNHNSYNGNFNSVWSGGLSMADRLKNNNNNNSNVTISHESSNRFDSSGVFTQNNSNNCWSNVVRNDSTNDVFANNNNNNNFRTPVKFDMGWNENKNKKQQQLEQHQPQQQVTDNNNAWGSGFAGKFGENSGKTENSGFGFSSNLDWGSKTIEKPKSQSSIFSDSIFSNPSSNNKITSNPSSRFDTAWSTNVEITAGEKKLSSERTPSSSIFDQNNNPLDDDFNPTGFFNDVFSQMSVQDNKPVQQKPQECSIFGGSSLFENNNKRVNNSTESL